MTTSRVVVRRRSPTRGAELGRDGFAPGRIEFGQRLACETREMVERIGLREWLLQQDGEEKLPRPLAEAAQRLPRELRPGAEKFAVSA